jgi:hypothetical protein
MKKNVFPGFTKFTKFTLAAGLKQVQFLFEPEFAILNNGVVVLSYCYGSLSDRPIRHYELNARKFDVDPGGANFLFNGFGSYVLNRGLHGGSWFY